MADATEESREPSTHGDAVASTSDLSDFSAGLSVDRDADADSALGDVDTPESTQSVRSSIYDYVEEHGRTFHRYKQGKYWLPNDRDEQERLDLQHAVFTMRFDGELGLAPVTDPQAVLDLGTGTGVWAIECALRFPSARVLGTDLSPIQPEYVPPNCAFEVDDAEDEWVFSERFDYVHLRMMFHCFRDHRAVMQSAFDGMRPGGIMEWQDWSCVLQCDDGTMQGTAIEQWSRNFLEAGTRLGRDMRAPEKYRRWMRESGFVDVVEKRLAVPGNPWAKGRDNKRMGYLQMANFLDGLHAASMTLFTKGLGMSPEAVELLLVDCRKDIKNTGIHFYWVTHVVYGRKP